MKRATTEARFWAYVDKTSTCWIWRGPMCSHGRCGEFKVDGRLLSPATFAHFLVYGAYPAGYAKPCPAHAQCIRPDHRQWRTNQERAREYLGRSRHARAHGEQAGNAKLTEAAVIALREKYAQGWSQYELAQTFGCSRTNIAAIVTGKTWRHLLTADELAALHEGAA